MNVERMRKANARRKAHTRELRFRLRGDPYLGAWLTDPTWEALTKALTRAKAAQDPKKVFVCWSTEDHALEDMTEEQRERYYKAKWSAE